MGGGQSNQVTGAYGTVPGGLLNAAAAYSFAAGRNARAVNAGSFVFNDSFGTSFSSSGPNQFAARANSGFYFCKTGSSAVIPAAVTINTDTGAFLTNGGVWTNASDVNKKEDFAAIDTLEVLRKVVDLPITSWKYKVEAEGTKHVGPMAQDFMAAFGLGESDLAIGTVDADGVALAAIQGLNAKVEQKEARIERLEALVTELLDRIEELEND
ncbi:MAG: tail fiber domain-containing protein [Planctomycetota bacterium]